MLQQTLAVLLVLGLLAGALWLLRQRGSAASQFVLVSKLINRNTSARRLRVVERVSLTPQHSLHLVAIDDQFLLVATSPSGCQPVEAKAVLSAGSSLRNGATC